MHALTKFIKPLHIFFVLSFGIIICLWIAASQPAVYALRLLISGLWRATRFWLGLLFYQPLGCVNPIRIVLPFKDQKSANVVRKQLADLSRKINADISPVYTSKKIKDEIKVKEDKPPLVSQQCVVYSFQCSPVSYTHLTLPTSDLV